MRIYKIIISLLFITGCSASLFAQSMAETPSTANQSASKSWEFGLGGSVFQFNRTSFSNFKQLNDGGYKFDLKLKHAVYGLNLYVARELNSHFYVDIQGSSGFTKESLGNDDKTKWLFMVGTGIQWRIGEYFGSKYIDPYLRAGINYMHKGFDISYVGAEGLTSEQMKWELENMHNKDGVDRKDMMPISLGGGLNMWMNDKFGIGFQGDYLLMPYKGVANSLQGTVRVMYRLGGASKKQNSVIEYVEREVIVEKPVFVEKIIEKTVQPVESGQLEKSAPPQDLYSYFKNLNFDFNKADLASESKEIIDEVAAIMKQNPDKKYLITGYTDAKGSVLYNQKLSQKRAANIAKALVDAGVDKSNLKVRGVGSRVALAPSNVSDAIRKGDRKVTVEEVSNVDYWNYLSD